VYTRGVDGSPAVRLGEGASAGLSPDGKWALSITPTTPPRLVALATGAGEPRTLVDSGFEQFFSARWTPDGRAVFAGAEPGKFSRVYVVDAAGGTPRAITPENVRGTLVTPDGAYVTCVDLATKAWTLYPIDGGEPRALDGLQVEESPLRWAADGKSLFVRAGAQFPVKIVRFTPATGRRETVAELEPADRTGVKPYPRALVVTPDGKSFAYTYIRGESELYLLEGCTGWCRSTMGST
jgi:Tol biopolymer transport system component